MRPDRCPDCGVPYVLVGRAHRCMPRPRVETVDSQAKPAGGIVIVSAGQGVAVVHPEIERQLREGGKKAKNVVNLADHRKPEQRRKPKRDRAAYMRAYRASKRNKAGG